MTKNQKNEIRATLARMAKKPSASAIKSLIRVKLGKTMVLHDVATIPAVIGNNGEKMSELCAVVELSDYATRNAENVTDILREISPDYRETLRHESNEIETLCDTGTQYDE